MSLPSWIRVLRAASPQSPPRQTRGQRRPPFRPDVELLEDRCLPATGLSASLVADIVPGTDSSSPFNLVPANGTLFFTVVDSAATGRQGLWKSDGTAAGSEFVAPLTPQNTTAIGGSVFFTQGGSELWTSDGTAAGTDQLLPSGAPTYLTVAGGKLYFASQDEGGRELWASDGTTAGTVLVKDIFPGTHKEWRLGWNGEKIDHVTVPNTSDPQFLTNFNGMVFFTAIDGTHGRELWKSDGTAAGTLLVKDLERGSRSSSPFGLTVVNGLLYFGAAGGLWRSDGTTAGTSLVKQFNRVNGDEYLMDTLAGVNGTVYCQIEVNDGTSIGYQLWNSDGTSAGTVLVMTSALPFRNLTDVNGTLFFTAEDGIHGRELWKSNGTPAGTVLVKDIAPGSANAFFDALTGGDAVNNWLTNINGLLYCAADDGNHGKELWQSDGTASGTVMVQDIYGGNQGSHPSDLVAMNNKLYFSATDPTHGRELWDPPPVEPSFTNVLVNDPTADLTSHDTQSETAMVLGPGNRVIVAYTDTGSQVEGAHVTGYAVSTNGGQSFTDRGTLPSADGGDPVLARSARTGTVFLSVFALDFEAIQQTERINVFRSTDNGLTFQPSVNGAPGFVAGVDHHDKPWIAVDNFPGPGYGNVYMTWRDFSSNPATNGILFTRSTDDGLTWGPDGGTLIQAQHNQFLFGQFVAVGPDHSVYLSSYDYQSHGDIWVRKSTDQGLTFGAPVHVARLLSNDKPDLRLGGFQAYILPQLVVNPVNGHLYMVYPDDPPSKDRADIFFTQSTDGGASWSSPMRVNDDATRNDQWQPTLAVTPDGSKVGVFWYDRRLDPANNLIDYFGTIGTVAGSAVSFGPNFRISDVSFPPVFGQDPPMPPPTYMGDYDVAQADDSFFYVTWGDNRLGDTFHAHQPDVRFARIPVTGPAAALAAAGPGTSSPNIRKFPQEAVQPILSEVLAKWAVPGVAPFALAGIDVRQADLARATLGLAAGYTIRQDDNAAGWGWIADRTPRGDSEFKVSGNQGERRRMDLLTLLAQEVGHPFGDEHEQDGAMQESSSTRQRPSPRGVQVNDSSWLFGLPDWTKKRDSFGWWL